MHPDRPVIGARAAARGIVAPCAILVAALMVSSVTIGHAPVFDDHLLLGGNADLISGRSSIHEAFSRRYWGTAPEAATNELYRPLTVMSLALDARLLGPGPRGMHAGNILLHAINAVLLWLLTRILLHDRPLAFLTGLCFAVHPLNTEAVAPLAGRADLLAAFWTFCAAVLAVLAARRDGPAALVGGAAAAIACALGSLSKEHVITAPLILAILLAVDPQRRPARIVSWRRLAIPIGGAIAVAAALTLRVRVLGYLWRSPLPFSPIERGEALVGNPLLDAAPLERLFTVAGLVVRIARLLVFPFPQSADYCYDQIPVQAGWPGPTALAGTLILAAGLVAFLRSLPARPVIAIGLGWAGLTWLVTSNLLAPIGTIFAERLLYLPLAGFCLLLAGALTRIGRSGAPGRRIAILVVLLIVPMMAWRCVSRAAQWADDASIFEATVEASPRCARAHANLGFVHLQAGRHEAAAEAYTRALEIAPGLHGLGVTLTGLLVDLGRSSEACDAGRRVASRFPDSAAAHAALARALEADGLRDEAETSWRRAMRVSGGTDAGAILGLASHLIASGREDEAIAIGDEAARLEGGRPLLAAIRFEAGLAALDREDLERFVDLMQAALDADPGHGPARFNLALHALRQGDRVAAKRYAESARAHGYALPPGFLETLADAPREIDSPAPGRDRTP